MLVLLWNHLVLDWKIRLGILAVRLHVHLVLASGIRGVRLGGRHLLLIIILSDWLLLNLVGMTALQVLFDADFR